MLQLLGNLSVKVMIWCQAHMLAGVPAATYLNKMLDLELIMLLLSVAPDCLFFLTLAGGPADQAGLQQLDTLLQLNGQPVEQWKCVDLAHAIRYSLYNELLF